MSKLVKVKILKYVGQWTPGDIIEVSESQAEELCKVGEIQMGADLQKHYRAMRIEDVEKLEVYKAQSIHKMTAAEATALGLKNIVKSPVTDRDAVPDVSVSSPADFGKQEVKKEDPVIAQEQDEQEQEKKINPASGKPYTKKELAAIAKSQAQRF